LTFLNPALTVQRLVRLVRRGHWRGKMMSDERTTVLLPHIATTSKNRRFSRRWRGQL
jgi:hypothetical protein